MANSPWTKGAPSNRLDQMDSLATFVANLRRLRREAGLTQERLAEQADLHMTDIARIETLRRDPGVKVVAKIASGLGVPAAALFEGIPNDSAHTPAEPGSSDPDAG
jgi:transcriptional regulator with XRE-family HTH domain